MEIRVVSLYENDVNSILADEMVLVFASSFFVEFCRADYCFCMINA